MGPAFARRLRPLALIPFAALLALGPAATGVAAAKPGPLKCTVKGTKRADELRGTEKADVICAGGGDDSVLALGGNDYVFGEDGDDRAAGGPGRDHLLGENGDDRLSGGPDADWLYGEEGNDQLAGGPDHDALYGDLGDDRHRGGPGQDLVSGGPGANSGVSAPAWPPCPSPGPACHISIHLDVGVYCPSFTSSVGLPPCYGRTPYATLGWDTYVVTLPGLFSQFGWVGAGPKQTTYAALIFGVPSGRIEGSVPGPGSADWRVEDAYALKSANPGIHLRTPNFRGIAAGQPGGPLYLNFVSGRIGADIYIDGYLVPR